MNNGRYTRAERNSAMFRIYQKQRQTMGLPPIVRRHKPSKSMLMPKPSKAEAARLATREQMQAQAHACGLTLAEYRRAKILREIAESKQPPQ
jgi:hypothetical protein